MCNTTEVYKSGDLGVSYTYTQVYNRGIWGTGDHSPYLWGNEKVCSVVVSLWCLFQIMLQVELKLDYVNHLNNLDLHFSS